MESPTPTTVAKVVTVTVVATLTLDGNNATTPALPPGGGGTLVTILMWIYQIVFWTIWVGVWIAVLGEPACALFLLLVDVAGLVWGVVRKWAAAGTAWASQVWESARIAIRGRMDRRYQVLDADEESRTPSARPPTGFTVSSTEPSEMRELREAEDFAPKSGASSFTVVDEDAKEFD